MCRFILKKETKADVVPGEHELNVLTVGVYVTLLKHGVHSAQVALILIQHTDTYFYIIRKTCIKKTCSFHLVFYGL